MIPAELWEKYRHLSFWRNGRAGRAGRICGRTPPSGRGLVRGRGRMKITVDAAGNWRLYTNTVPAGRLCSAPSRATERTLAPFAHGNF